MSKIYTKTGDSGQTSLIGGQRVAKTHPRLEAYGTVDELTSHLGLLRSLLRDEQDKAFVLGIQKSLFSLSAQLATPPESKYQPEPFAAEQAEAVEAEIDRLQAELPPFRCFIIPGEGQASSQAHICRTVCRRAERCILALAERECCTPQACVVSSEVLRYINRLSDYLFVLARRLEE